MTKVSDLIKEIDGTGYTQEELFEITREITEFTISRDKLYERLAKTFDSEELDEILLTVEAASFEEMMMAKVLDRLAPKQKRYYLMYTVEKKNMGQIAKEFGVAKGSVSKSILQAREKITILKKEHLTC